MLHGSLKPDAIGSNASRVAEIKGRLGTFDDQIPFLLLPLRVETRFAKSERTMARAPDVETLQAQLAGVTGLLQELATYDLGTLTGVAKRHARWFVESCLSQLDAMAAKVQATLDSVLGSDAQQGRQLSLTVREIAALEAAARANLGRLKSDYLRHDFEANWDSLVSARLAPMRSAIDTRVVRRIRFRARLSVVAAHDLHAALDTAQRTLAEATQLRPASWWREQRPQTGTTQLDNSAALTQLADLHGMLDHAVHASTVEQQTLAQSWRSLAETVDTWIAGLQDDSERAEAKRLRTGISLLGGSNGARVRIIGTRDLDRSAAAYSELLVRMREATLKLRAPVESGAFEEALSALAARPDRRAEAQRFARRRPRTAPYQSAATPH